MPHEQPVIRLRDVRRIDRRYDRQRALGTNEKLVEWEQEIQGRPRGLSQSVA
jgi:hypothetical protein